MLKLAAAVVFVVGCKGGDKCEQMFEKLKTGLEKDLGHAPDKDAMLNQCRAGLEKHPESAKMIDCVLAVSGEPSKEDMQRCMDPEDRHTPEAAKKLKKLAATAIEAHAKTGSYPVGKVPLSPAKECCFGDPSAVKTVGKCSVDTAVWQDPTWKALAFSIDEPSTYRYSYESDGKTFTALAVGDADCDEKLATFKMVGTADGKTELTPPAKGEY